MFDLFRAPFGWLRPIGSPFVRPALVEVDWLVVENEILREPREPAPINTSELQETP